MSATHAVITMLSLLYLAGLGIGLAEAHELAERGERRSAARMTLFAMVWPVGVPVYLVVVAIRWVVRLFRTAFGRRP